MGNANHLVNWYKSIHGNSEVTLAIRRRSFCGRSIYSIDKLVNTETSINFNHALHGFLYKSYLVRYLKEEKLVEAVALAFYIRSKTEDFSNVQKTGDPRLQEVQLFLNGELLKIHDAPEWMRRINNYINKNVAIKKQTDVLLKKKFLTLFKDCKFLCSQVYDFKTYKAKLPDLPKSGKLCVNVTGVFFFEEGNFKTPNFYIMMNELVEFEQKGSKLKLKFNEGRALRTIFLQTGSSKQLCEDIASSIVLGLRENRYYVYSYLYINKMLPPGITASRKSLVEQLHGQRISKCTENLNSLGDNIIPYQDLPFTKRYQETIVQQHEQDFYYPFRLTDINREAARLSAKKNRMQIGLGLMSNQNSMQADRKMGKSESNLFTTKPSVRFEETEKKDDDSSQGSNDDQGPPPEFDPALLSLKNKRR